jgi:biotin carboxylase
MSSQEYARKRILLLASKLGYQTREFGVAAERLGIAIVFGTDRCHVLEDPWNDAAIPLRFEDAAASAAEIRAHFAAHPPAAILALGDRPTLAASMAARDFGLPGNPPEAVEACRSKLRQREIFAAAGLPVPEFFTFALADSLDSVLSRVKFPCVVKPLSLSASTGVIRTNDPEEFRAAVARIRILLQSPEIQVLRESSLDRLLVESYIPGREVALEGLLTAGRLRILAIFDKPDPLEGPYFEESIYVTPSRLNESQQQASISSAERAVRALGLHHGPVHAEFRINDQGPWILEIAARPIGGLCSRALRFGGPAISESTSFEELLLRHALGMPTERRSREPAASGVMMIPVPSSGIFKRVEGLESARAVPGVEEILITARPHDYIAAWPEGASYLGFIFARTPDPAAAEAALRAAHSHLRFIFSPRLCLHPAR